MLLFVGLVAQAAQQQQQQQAPAPSSAAGLLAEGERLGRQNERSQALEKFQAALEAARSEPDRKLEARALTRLGQTYLQLDRFAEGLRHLELAAPVWRDAQDRFQEAITVHNIGSALWSMGDSPAAVSRFETALSIRREIKDRIGEAYTLRGLAGCYWSMGEPAEALDLARQALAIRTGLKDEPGEADSRNFLGLLYALLGDAARARAEFERSLELWTKSANPQQVAATQNNLGWTAVGLRQYSEALRHLRPAAESMQKAGNRHALAYALHNLGNAHAGLKQYAEAVAIFEQSLAIKREFGDRWAETYTLHALGETRIALGDREAGVALLQQALEARRTLRDRTGLIVTLGSLAQIHRDAGDWRTAEAEIREAIDAIESSRSHVVSQDLRATYLASKRDYFEFLVGLLAAGNRPAEALEAAEQARGRMLLDRLGDTLAGIRSATGAASQREQAAIRRVNTLADRLERLAAARQSNPALEARLKQDLDRAIAEARDAAESVRRASPRYGDLLEPARMAEAGIRKLLQPGEVLLSYSLGRESSFVWIVTSSNTQMRKLPSRSQIEHAASTFTRAIATRQTDWQPAAATLEKLILPLLPSRATRVIVTPDGGLEAVPFAALPTLSAHNLETAYLPSASALALRRRSQSNRREQPQAVLALGDPVLSASDSRNPNPPAARDQQPNSLARLRFSRIEVDTIAGLLPSGQVRKALDFDAARSTLFSGAARNAAIVHLAAHAIVDPVRPELSRLVLSAVDSRGGAVEPSVRLHEIYNLELPQTRLVTLSACRSAIGTALPGEGLVSLTRGFQYAGAASVLATLWDVEDRSTSRWMESFYRSLLVQRRPAAAAVREAMRTIRSNPETAHPFYWSGFVLQGEWR